MHRQPFDWPTGFEGASERHVRICLERIAMLEGEVRAWAHLDPDAALAKARLRDSELPKSPLHGAAVGIKDVFDTEDMPTGYGFGPLRNHCSGADSAIVSALRALGMVILGKTATTEFAGPVPETAPTRHPLDASLSPGFSSSGSAAAVASGMVPFAIGTQTGASIIRPAAFCGIYGFKPSHGRLNTAGLRHAKPSIDTIGLFTHSLEMMQRFSSALGISALPYDTTPRVGLCRTRHWANAETEIHDAMNAAALALRAAGIDVVDVELPSAIDGFETLFDTVMTVEHALSLREEYERSADDMHPWNRSAVERGRNVPEADYRRAMADAEELRKAVDDAFDSVDLLLTPSAECAAPPIEKAVSGPWFRDWTFLHTPCLNLPHWATEDGRPIGLQIVGKRGLDEALLTAAAQLDAVFGEAAGEGQ